MYCLCMLLCCSPINRDVILQHVLAEICRCEWDVHVLSGSM